MPFQKWLAAGTAIDPATTNVNFAGMSASKSGDTTTLTVSGAESVTVQTATTSVLTPIVDAIAAGALSLAPTTATSITLGQTCNVAANKNIACATGTSAFDFSLGTGVFKTPTGAHTLAGDVTISGSKAFTTGTGTVTINGTVAVAANVNAACAAGTSAFDYSLGTGVFKTSSGTNTLAGDVVISGTKAFTTGTGTVTINGTVAVAANVNAACAAGTSAFDYSLGTGVFKTSTGAVSINGTTTIAASKSVSCAAGTTGLDFNLGTGAYRFGAASATVGFYGATAVALQTGVAVTAMGIHAALVNLGLITA